MTKATQDLLLARLNGLTTTIRALTPPPIVQQIAHDPIKTGHVAVIYMTMHTLKATVTDLSKFLEYDWITQAEEQAERQKDKLVDGFYRYKILTTQSVQGHTHLTDYLRGGLLDAESHFATHFSDYTKGTLQNDSTDPNTNHAYKLAFARNFLDILVKKNMLINNNANAGLEAAMENIHTLSDFPDAQDRVEIIYQSFYSSPPPRKP